jgi:hypothetical protein
MRNRAWGSALLVCLLAACGEIETVLPDSAVVDFDAPPSIDAGVDADIDAPPIVMHTLTVSITGNGTGMVTSTPNGINCPGTCTLSVAEGTQVTLTAAPSGAAMFVGWTAPGCATASTCVVTVDSDMTAVASFALNYTIVVTKTGSGTGTVSSSPSGIDCGSTCNATYPASTVVTLSAAASTDSTFTGWSGPCSGTGNCVVTVTAAVSVGANFDVQRHTLGVSVGGSGTGSVTSNSGGIVCPGTCSATYPYGTNVTLTPSPSGGSTFAGWTGACTGSGACTVSMTQTRSVTASFNAPIAPNLMFVTSTTYTGNLGGLAGADAICRERANAGGRAGTYKAWLSTSTVNANTRLGTASGWVRVDGKPFVSSMNDLGNGKLFTPPRIDEFGNDIGEVGAMTSTTTGGVYANNGDCAGWTSSSSGAQVSTGTSAGNGAMFEIYGIGNCAGTFHLYCFGVDRTATVTPAPQSGTRKAFMRLWTPGGGIASADAACASDAAAAGLSGTYRALLGTIGASPLSRFNLALGAWAKVDNVVTLPSAQAWSTATYFDAPPNLTANGQTNFGNYRNWTGASSLTAAGTATSTCNNWTDTNMNASTGIAGNSRISSFFGASNHQCNFTAGTITCLEQ